MKKFILVFVWDDGTETPATKPVTDRQKLEKARDVINEQFGNDPNGLLVLREI